MIPLLLVACEKSTVEVIPGAEGRVTLTLVNPTTCEDCDPFSGVDTLRVDVLVGGEVVATDTFAYPEEQASLPGTEVFGVARIEVAGLSGGRVVSGGRTPEIAVSPTADVEVPLLFLPVNETLPLNARMNVLRSEHVARRIADGRVLLVGGASPGRDGAYDSVEVWDPATGTFEGLPARLPESLAGLRADWAAGQQLLLVGGHNLNTAGQELTREVASVWSDADASIDPIGDMTATRTGHCFAMFRDRHGIVFGGNDTTDLAEYVHLESGGWEFLGVRMNDFDQADVTGCVRLADGRVYVQGRDRSSTGVWDYTQEAAELTEMGDAFRAIPGSAEDDAKFVEGAALAALSNGNAWIGGGTDLAGGTATKDARMLKAENLAFLQAPDLAAERVDGVVSPWIREDWFVLGCGYADAERRRAAPNIELFAPLEEGVTLEIEGDRDRLGCQTTVMDDGAILVTGGFDTTDTSAISAAVIVPWLE